jgi:hypothetical protein
MKILKDGAIPAHGLTESILYKWLYCWKWSVCSMQFLYKLQWYSSQDRKSILKLIRKHERPWVYKTILRKKSNTGGVIILVFKLYFRAIAVKTEWCWLKNRHEDQWNSVEDSDRNPHSYTHLSFDKGTQNIHCRKNSLFDKCCGENWISTFRRLKLDFSLLP